jgi:hypothetical protein
VLVSGAHEWAYKHQKTVRCYKYLVPTALEQTANAECLDQMVRPESLQMSKLQSHEAFMAGLTLYKARPDKGL